ncbi:MAG: C25 family cysteine peptidase [Bacteroidota bacterium]|nr:C25 family cysteine peptidase [Bacteroidota bacterium]
MSQRKFKRNIVFSYLIIPILLLLCKVTAFGQMNFNGHLVFGHEWIDPKKDYFKFSLDKDAIYRLDYKLLLNSGIPVGTLQASKFQLFHLGEEIDVYISTEGVMQLGDYIEIWATKNRGELDRALFKNSGDIFNPAYSLFTDVTAYYLSWSDQNSSHRISLIQNDISNSIPEDEYCLVKETIVYNENSIKRSVGTQRVEKFPDFDAAQGYGTSFFNNRTFVLNFPKFYKNDIPAKIRYRMTGDGQDASAHKVDIFINNTLADKIVFPGYTVLQNELTIPADSLSVKKDLKFVANGFAEDRVSVAQIEIIYPKLFDFEKKKMASFSIPASPIRKFLVLKSFDGGNEMTLFNKTHNFYIRSNKEANDLYTINLPPATNERDLIIWNDSEVIKISHLTKIKFDIPVPDNYDYLILSHPKLMGDGSGTNSIQEYADYRQSAEGGSHKVHVVNVTTLFDLFGYGIPTHSIALRNYFQYLKNINPNLKEVFIIGKGLEYPVYRKNVAEADSFLFVPTYGLPAADGLLVADSFRIQNFAIGRLPAINVGEVKAYLEKVKLHERYLENTKHDIEHREWIKRVMHLSGGRPGDYGIIRSQLEGMENIIEQNQFGADVTTFYKESSGPIQVSQTEEIKKLINSGVSYISFMGHSAPSTLDFNIESVQSLNNKPRFPAFMALGCYAGQMFQNFKSISEEYNLAQDKGSIVYLSNSTAGLIPILSVYGNELYDQMGGDLYGSTLGKIVQEVNKTMLAFSGEAIQTQALSISFNGDPAIRFHLNPKQDYTPDTKTIQTAPKTIHSSLPEFNFSFDIINLGRSYQDSITVLIVQESPDGEKTKIIEQKYLAPAFRKNYTFKIPVYGDASIGFNKLYVTLDPDNEIAELPNPEAELNNSFQFTTGELSYNYYVSSNIAQALFPEEFSIVTSDQPHLYAYNGNTFAPVTNYTFEIDTTAYFNSSFKKTKTVTQTGASIEWQTGINLIPEKVHYWRVSQIDSLTGRPTWDQSSFIFLPNESHGWNQSHFFQYKRDSFINLILEEPARTFEYQKSLLDIRITNAHMPLPNFARPRIFLGGEEEFDMDFNYRSYPNIKSGLLVSVIDPLNGKLWINKTGTDHNSYNGGYNFSDKKFFFFYSETQEQRGRFISFVKNVIPDDHIIIIHVFSVNNNSYFSNTWEADGTENIYSVLTQFGARQINDLKILDDLPYILIFQKNNSNYEIKEAIGNETEKLEITHKFEFPLTNGQLFSTVIGPSSSWNTFLWNRTQLDTTEDVEYIQIYGVDTSGLETDLFGNIEAAKMDLSSINTSQYPFLKLSWTSSDTVSRSPSNLDYWRILYEGLPDIAFNPAFHYTVNKDTLNQGENFLVEIAAINLSHYDMDSLLVKFTLLNESNQGVSTFKKFLPVNSFESIQVIFNTSTSGQAGLMRLLIELNPDQDQKERITFNNVAELTYYVLGDVRRPLLEVLFDQKQIFDGELVSAKVDIGIYLRDEIFSAALTDTSLFEIWIIDPNDRSHRIYINQNNVTFTPSNSLSGGTKNEANVIIKNNFVLDGYYQLIVRAKDLSGNSSSSGEYIISFQVINKQAISNILNCPNPFITGTKFLYTLTGSDIPAFYKIQLFNVSGILVKEISQEELGPLCIGTHLTNYTYYGEDASGNRLAKGLYLYQLIAKDNNGKDLEKYGEDTKQNNKNDFGKMVILR